MSDDIQGRLDTLIERLRTAYDGIGHSSGRPYVYFVYPPAREREIHRMADQQLKNHAPLAFHQIDVLTLAIESLYGQEERRQQFLNDPQRIDSALEAIFRLWTRKITTTIHTLLTTTADERPVVVLRNLAALHPLGNPTSLMEFLAEKEPRNPKTGSIVPIVLLVPGYRPPQTSRLYYFLDQERLECDFYRGEEI